MTSRLFRFLCLMIGLFAAALPAQAAPPYWNPYVGAGVGSFIIDAGLGSKQAFGGYGMVGNDFNDYVGAEIRFGATGSTGGTLIIPQGVVTGVEGQTTVIVPVPTPAKVGLDWFVAYLLKLQYPFTNGFRVYGVVGATTIKAKFSFVSPVSGLMSFRTTKTSFSFGGGFDYGLSDAWRVGVDATAYSNKATTSPAGANFTGLDVWGVTATARYAF